MSYGNDKERAQENRAGSASVRKRKKRRLGWVVLLVAAIAVAWGVYSYGTSDGESESGQTSLLHTVTRGNLTVSVLEGGTIKAMESQEIKCEAQGQHRILSIVPEGTIITPEDLENEKVLVELDSSNLEEEQAQREISFESVKASYTTAQESHEIQKQQNESNIAMAQLNQKFARMDLEQYLGKGLGQVVMDEGEDFDFSIVQYLGAESEEQKETAQMGSEPGPSASASGASSAATQALSGGSPDMPKSPGPGALDTEEREESSTATEVLAEIVGQPPINLDGYPRLGGEAQKQLDELKNNVTIAAEQLERSQNEYEWSQRLAAQEYITEDELRADELARNKAKVNVEQAKTSLALFVKYELSKLAEQRYADWRESQRELKRVKAKANSELAQSEANLRSKEASFNLQKQRLDRVLEDIEACIISAQKPGMVIYASTVDPRRFRDNPIQEGYTVREKETIMTVPNMSTLAVEVEVHETDIKKIKKDQPARITLQAMQDQTFDGHVERISVMASSEHRWLNPNTMVYPTDVAIEDTTGEMKPGMSATAEIIVADLQDVIYVPIQAVDTKAGQRICWVRTPQGPELREVETGYYTDEHVEITSGLKEGEQVYLVTPEGMELEEAEEKGPEAEGTEGSEGGSEPDRAGGSGRDDQSQEASGDEEKPEVELPDDPAKIREKLQNMSREERMQFFQSLTDEQREKVRQAMPRRPGGGRGGRPGGGGMGGGGGRRAPQGGGRQ